jgi:hypothetical protein
MRLRRSLLTALVVALAATTATSATAKPKKPITYCNLLTDNKGDGRSSTYSFVTSPALDIVSGDIATAKDELVAVLRVDNQSTSGDNWLAVGGYGWIFGATAGGVPYTFTYNRRGMFNGSGEAHSATVGTAGVESTFKIVGNTFEWHVSRKLLTALNKKAGQVFTSFHGESQFNGSTADSSYSAPSVKYPDRGLSCVKAK